MVYSYNAIDWVIFDDSNSPIGNSLSNGGSFHFLIDTLNNVWVSDVQNIHVYNPDGYDNTWLSTQEQNLSSSISIYPNPVNTTLNILGVNTNATYKIYNSIGQIQTAVKTNNTISVEHLKNGIYFIEITTNNKTIIKRFVKQ